MMINRTRPIAFVIVDEMGEIYRFGRVHLVSRKRSLN